MSSSADRGGTAPGRFITLEGGEGAGKSTQVRLLVERLAADGIETLATREPGGTPLAEAYRAALLSGAVAPLGIAAEALVFSGARIDHLDGKILPALRAGRTVVCDRFIDSTRAYQGALGDLDPRLLGALERVVVGRHLPDLTLILDLQSDVGLARAAARRGQGGAPDRFERQDNVFHATLRAAFLDIAAREPGRCRVIDASGPADAVGDAIWQAVRHLFSQTASAGRAPVDDRP